MIPVSLLTSSYISVNIHTVLYFESSTHICTHTHHPAVVNPLLVIVPKKCFNSASCSPAVLHNYSDFFSIRDLKKKMKLNICDLFLKVYVFTGDQRGFFGLSLTGWEGRFERETD